MQNFVSTGLYYKEHKQKKVKNMYYLIDLTVIKTTSEVRKPRYYESEGQYNSWLGITYRNKNWTHFKTRKLSLLQSELIRISMVCLFLCCTQRHLGHQEYRVHHIWWSWPLIPAYSRCKVPLLCTHCYWAPVSGLFSFASFKYSKMWHNISVWYFHFLGILALLFVAIFLATRGQDVVVSRPFLDDLW